MSGDQRFRAPSAAVADIGAPPTAGRGPAIVMGLFLALQGLWVSAMLPGLWMLISEGAMNPLGLLLLALGEVCLACGVALMAWRSHRGARSFQAALVLLLLNRWAWRSAWMTGLLPIGVGVVLAAVGCWISWNRRRTLRAAAIGSPAP